jgi:hypothetical protein
MQADLFATGDSQTFSPCGLYRYELVRVLQLQHLFHNDGPPALFCGLNPSVAGSGATKDDNDPTVRKWIGFARRWGCGSIVIVNAYGYVETHSEKLSAVVRRGVDIVGPDNDRYIRAAVDRVVLASGKVVVCWGAKISAARQSEISYVFGDAAMCLGTNKDGTPEHALYIPYERPLVHWSCP